MPDSRINARETILNINRFHIETLDVFTHHLYKKFSSALKLTTGEELDSEDSGHLKNALQRLLRIYGLCGEGLQHLRRFSRMTTIHSLEESFGAFCFWFSQIQYVGGSIFIESIVALQIDLALFHIQNLDKWIASEEVMKIEEAECYKENSLSYRRAFSKKLRQVRYPYSKELTKTMMMIYRSLMRFSEVFLKFFNLDEAKNEKDFMSMYTCFTALISLSLELYAIYMKSHLYLKAFRLYLLDYGRSEA
ncbi:MAG: hypothetical protein RDV48_30870 [Candidatus Eremiobacteraeota bacterium]|nr:hypothetical protein [Candidatus Eremiobacteraeota bacterium]